MDNLMEQPIEILTPYGPMMKDPKTGKFHMLWVRPPPIEKEIMDGQSMGFLCWMGFHKYKPYQQYFDHRDHEVCYRCGDGLRDGWEGMFYIRRNGRMIRK